MADFDSLDEVEAPETLGKIANVKVPWMADDIPYWFSEVEMQMELYNVKSQWIKRIILNNNLPENIRSQIKDLAIILRNLLSSF